MPVLIAMLWGAFIRVLPTVVGQVLIALGISAVTYSGVDTTLTWVLNEAKQNAAALPADLLGLLSVMKVGQSVNIVFSAMVARMTVQGLQGTFKRWVTK